RAPARRDDNGLRQRWFGATRTRVPELAVDGDPLVPLDGALVLDSVDDDSQLREAHAAGRPVVVRADSAGAVLAALKRPEVGVVDGRGGSATFTGGECLDWAGGTTGPCYAAQGNILVSSETVEAIAASFERSAGMPLAERLLAALDAAQAAGGDRRGQQSSALLVVEKDGGYAKLSDTIVDLRVEDHARPPEELRRLYGLHQAISGETP